MRILFLSGWYPYPPDNGSRIRICNVLRQLAADHQVTLLSFASRRPAEDELAAIGRVCEDVQVAPHIAYQPTRLRALLGLLSTRPRSFADTYSRPMADLVRAACSRERFDLVIASQVQMAPYALLVDGVPRLLEEIELATIRDPTTQERGARRLRCELTWLKTRDFVRRLVRHFDGCTVVSAQERDLLAEVAPDYRRVWIVPNGVDLETYGGVHGVPEPDTLIHTGALSYRANYDAVDYFLREVLPLVRRRRPGALLRITGATDGLSGAVVPSAPGAVYTGYLGDIRPAIAQSWVSVVPLRIGGGTRLKILEAMALGTPVVSTGKGAEGLDVCHEENILLSDTPAGLAEAIVRVLDAPDLRARLAAGGHRLVTERYGWERIGRDLRGVVDQVAGVAP